jgi:hypothetical protein
MMASGDKTARKRANGLTAPLRRYFKQSSDPLTSLILVLPIFLAYQLGVLFTGGVQNGVDFATGPLMALSQGSTANYLMINAGLLAVYLGAILYLRRTHAFEPKVWPWVIGESALYALFFGSAIIQIMKTLGMGALLATGASAYQPGVVDALVMSLGAGLYEETVFRLIGVGGVVALVTRILPKVPMWAIAGVVVVASSAVFSGIHYVGSMGDAFTLGSFLFRFFAGLLLALVFYTRGFAVAVYTHAFYDILVMVFKT